MAKSLLCYLGLHRWQRKRSDDGKPYKECQRRGQFKDVPDPVIGPF